MRERIAVTDGLAEAAMYLAVTGGGAALGAIAGAGARSMGIGANAMVLEGVSIGLGLALALVWCWSIGRRWVRHPWPDLPELASVYHRN